MSVGEIVMENIEKKERHSDHSDREYFKEILAYIDKTDLEFVQFERDGRKISFRRAVTTIVAPKAFEPAPKPEKKEEETFTYSSIRSPIVGRFHSSMGSDRPALVVEGGKVVVGQRVAVVEAMKIKKEVFSAVTGMVVKISVQDGDAVEYGQELFRVEPQREAQPGPA